MPDMNAHTQDRTVYVKTIAVSDLPFEVREQAEGLERLYAVHDADGQQLALSGIASWLSVLRAITIMRL